MLSTLTPPWSLALAILLGALCFGAFYLLCGLVERWYIRWRLAPLKQETVNLLLKNNLATGQLPNKARLVGLLSAISAESGIDLFSHWPLAQVIDQLIYLVQSNELLAPHQRRNLSENLQKLKAEPLSTADYLQLAQAGERKQLGLGERCRYLLLIGALIVASIVVISLLSINEYATSPSPLARTGLLAAVTFSMFTAIQAAITIWQFSQQAGQPSAKAAVPGSEPILAVRHQRSLHQSSKPQNQNNQQRPTAETATQNHTEPQPAAIN